MPGLDAAAPHLFAVAAGLLVVLPMWFAGGLANVDCSRIGDPGALNRWAMRRLLLLPAVPLLNALLALFGLAPDAVLWAIWGLAVFVVVAWLLIGGRRFQHQRGQAPWR